MAKKKTRLDVALVERNLAPSRAKAQAMIMAGEVHVNDSKVDKAGTRIADDDKIRVASKPRFVGRGGEKIEGALQAFQFQPADLVCADIGACTGGFTDCLLQEGASRVYAMDVGYGQLDYRLRTDERVVVMERTNARYVESLDEPVDFVVMDVSFISIRLILPKIKQWLSDNGNIISLVKPQFEAGKDDVGKGGIVRDPAIHRTVLHDITSSAIEMGFHVNGLTRSPITGSDGNVEFFIWLANYPDKAITTEAINEQIEALTT